MLRRTAVVAVVAAAIAIPITAPEPAPGSAPMVIAIARADCPPDCGPVGGGSPSGPPGGGTEFVPPSMPAMPSYEPGRGQPPFDQNNGISIYNSAAPQPSQAAQPSQAPIQNQDGTYNRAANGEQQPVNYNNAPNNQQLNNDWRRLNEQLNNQRAPGEQQPESTDQADPSSQSDQRNAEDSDEGDPDRCGADIDGCQYARQFCVSPNGLAHPYHLSFNNYPVRAKVNGVEVPALARIDVLFIYNAELGTVSATGTVVTTTGATGFVRFAHEDPTYIGPTLRARPGEVLHAPIQIYGDVEGEIDRLVEICDRFDNGTFAGSNGYGGYAEAKGIAEYAERFPQNKPLTTQKRRASFSSAPGAAISSARYYDGLARKPDGTYEGIEVKSNTADLDTRQKSFDAAVSPENPAFATITVDGVEKLITITSTALINVTYP